MVQPVLVDCKSVVAPAGHREATKLRKRLGIDRSQFIIFSPDLGEEQAAALSNMYELTSSPTVSA